MRRTILILLLIPLICSCAPGEVRVEGKRVLIYTRNGVGYVHDNIAASVAALEEICAGLGIETVATDSPAVFTPAGLEALVEYPWPGNVRELENTIKRTIVLARGTMITPDEIVFPDSDEIREGKLGGSREGVAHFVETALEKGEADVLGELEKVAIEKALSWSKGNQKKAAEALGISRTTLRAKMKEYDIKAGK